MEPGNSASRINTTRTTTTYTRGGGVDQRNIFLRVFLALAFKQRHEGMAIKQLTGSNQGEINHMWASHGIRIFSFILSCSHTLSSALAHCAPLLATAGTPMPAVVESPQR